MCVTKANLLENILRIQFITRSSATTEIACPKPCIAKKLDSLDYVFFVADSIGQIAAKLIHLAPKAGVLCEVTRIDGHRAVQGH